MKLRSPGCQTKCDGVVFSILEAESDARDSFRIESRTGEDRGNFPQVQLIKLSKVLQTG